MEEIESFLTKKERDLLVVDEGNPVFMKKYEYAQLLTCIGRQKEGIKYFQESFDEVAKYKNDEIWSSQYCLIGAQYAQCLDYLNENSAKTEEIYLQLMNSNPVGVHIGDYALFLHRRKRDYDKAESFYTKALELYPNHSSILLKYAGFVRHIRRDVARSESFYIKSIEANPENADALGAYASFLHGVYNKTMEAEEYYIKAIKYDNLHTNNLCNYGLFLSEEKQDYYNAELMYKQALLVNDKHPNTLYNFAVMLDTHLKRKSEAEILYRNAIKIETRHAYALYNLAVLLEEKHFITNAVPEFVTTVGSNKAIKTTDTDVQTEEEKMKSKMEIGQFYRRAVDADPKDASTLADYGRYLYTRLDEPNKAEPALVGALKLDPTCEIAIYNLAVLLYKHKNNADAAVSMLRSLVEKNPKHVNGLLQLARILREQFLEQMNPSKTATMLGKEIADLLEEAMECYENHITLSTEVDSVITEYMKLCSKYGSNRQKLHTISFINTTLQAKKGEDSAGNAVVNSASSLLELMSASMNK